MSKQPKKFQSLLAYPKNVLVLGILVAVTLASMPVQSVGVEAADAATEGVLAEAQATVPAAPKVTVLRTYRYVPMTAYTSRPEETDDTPFITADGSHVRDGIVACNFLPFGTKVRIPELFGDKVFEVHDRMNKRFPYKMDFWMAEYHDAITFGVKRAHIEIVTVDNGA